MLLVCIWSQDWLLGIGYPTGQGSTSLEKTPPHLKLSQLPTILCLDLRPHELFFSMLASSLMPFHLSFKIKPKPSACHQVHAAGISSIYFSISPCVHLPSAQLFCLPSEILPCKTCQSAQAAAGNKLHLGKGERMPQCVYFYSRVHVKHSPPFHSIPRVPQFQILPRDLIGLPMVGVLPLPLLLFGGRPHGHSARTPSILS